jgi:putative Mg2+ transporter-C (MgtC) family protein
MVPNSYQSFQSLAESALRLLAAAGAGGALGLNRDLHDKPAGMRTHALVALGSALVMVVSLSLAQPDTDGALRTVQGIITGIGFLGAGVILHDRVGRRVHGLTTAATVWIAAGLGIGCGAGQWGVVVLATALVFAILVFGGRIEHAFHNRFHSPAHPEDCDPSPPVQHP